MTTNIALLRSLNVGGKNRVEMTALRTLFTSLGAEHVRSFIQSGNIIFSSDGSISANGIEAAMRDRFGVITTAVLRDLADLECVVRDNPFQALDASTLHVGFFAHAPMPELLAQLEQDRFAPEAFTVHGRELYLYLPNGMARTKLPAYLERSIKIPTTIRSWKTVAAVHALASELPTS